MEKQITTVYKYPLRISPTCASTLYQWSCACRYLWNRSLRLKSGLYKRYKLSMGYFGTKHPDGINTVGTAKRLTILRARYEWLNALPCCTQQEVLRDLDKAFSNFFKRVKKGETPGYPRKKHRGDLHRLYFPKSIFRIDMDDQGRHYLKLPKIEALIRIDIDRPYLEHPADKIISLSIVHEREYWYVCILVEKTIDVTIRALPAVGINRGIVKTVALSNGTGYQLDTDKLKKLEDRKTILQTRLSRKIGSKKFEKKSGHWLQQKKQIDRLDHAMVDIRLNFNHQTSRHIVSHYGDISIEDYKIKQMTKSAKGTIEQPGTDVQIKINFNRAQLRQGWGQLGIMLEYKSNRLGHTVIKKSVPYITQECSSCGHTGPENIYEKYRRFKCAKCGFIKNMDTNAALNVLHR